MLKINCKGKRIAGKANEGINVEKYNSFKILKIEVIKKKKLKKKTEEMRKKKKKGKLHRTAKAQCRGRGL